MPVTRSEIDLALKSLLKPEIFSDYCPNGLQVEGRDSISKIVTGVTACQALIESAVDAGADALLVHHGYFWKGEDATLTGIKRRRIERLLREEISLFAYHLPLDVHEELGNNVQLARLLNLQIKGDLLKQNRFPLVLYGELETEMSAAQFARLLAKKLGRNPAHVIPEGRSADAMLKTFAWCTGAAQGYIDLAARAGVDAYISGEISEPTFHVARESSLHYFAAGHHATERYGVQAVGNYLAREFGITHQFIDIDNPV